MKAELKWNTTENGEQFVITGGIRKRRKLCVECLDFQTCCATPKGKYYTIAIEHLTETFRLALFSESIFLACSLSKNQY